VTKLLMLSLNRVVRFHPQSACLLLLVVFGLLTVGSASTKVSVPSRLASTHLPRAVAGDLLGAVADGRSSQNWIAAPATSLLFGHDSHSAAPRRLSAPAAATQRISLARISVVMTRRRCALSRKRVVADRVVFTLANQGRRAQRFSIHNRRSRLVAPGRHGRLRVSFGRTHHFRFNCTLRHPRRGPIRRGLLLVVTSGSAVRRPPPPPPQPPQSAWRATTETGNLSEWSTERGGGEYNSGGGDSGASQAVAHSGSWSARQAINTSGGSSGTRLFRWREYRSLPPGQPATTSVWVYIPSRPRIGGYFNLYQFKSKTQSGSYIDVFFQLNLSNRADGSLYLRAAWGCGAENPNFPHGPYANSRRLCDFFPPLATINAPIGRWFEIRSKIVPSSGYRGSIKFWQNGVLLYDFRNVMTGYPNTNSVNGVDTQWAVNAYANGLSPSSYVQYVDDATVARG
jgi:hypothetical protein